MDNSLATTFSTVALVCYLLGTAIVIRHLFGKRSQSKQSLTDDPPPHGRSNAHLKNFSLATSSKARLLLPGAIAAIPHLYYCVQTLFLDNGLNFGLFPILSLAGALMVLATVGISIKRPLENITIVVYPLASILLLSSLYFESGYQPRSDIPLPILAHITLSLLAYSALGIAFSQALLILAQSYELKHKHLAGIVRVLPPLQLMEKILFGLLWIGVGLLTLSIGTGIFYLENLFTQKLMHKTFFTILAWAIFTTLLIGRYYAGWRGVKAVHWSIGGFILLAIGFIGSKFVIEIILAG